MMYILQLDATNVGLLLFAEEKAIPTVIVASPSMLSLVSQNMPPWNGIKDFIKCRYDSLVFAGSFMQLNKVCREDWYAFAFNCLSFICLSLTDAGRFALTFLVAPIIWAPISTDTIGLF